VKELSMDDSIKTIQVNDKSVLDKVVQKSKFKKQVIIVEGKR
jgi:hypothetical protein